MHGVCTSFVYIVSQRMIWPNGMQQASTWFLKTTDFDINFIRPYGIELKPHSNYMQPILE